MLRHKLLFDMIFMNTMVKGFMSKHLKEGKSFITQCPGKHVTTLLLHDVFSSDAVASVSSCPLYCCVLSLLSGHSSETGRKTRQTNWSRMKKTATPFPVCSYCNLWNQSINNEDLKYNRISQGSISTWWQLVRVGVSGKDLSLKAF